MFPSGRFVRIWPRSSPWSNTVFLGRALEAAHHHGGMISDTLLVHLAPLEWQHINLTGDYHWNATSKLGPDGFKPLRGIEAEWLAAMATLPYSLFVARTVLFCPFYDAPCRHRWKTKPPHRLKTEPRG